MFSTANRSIMARAPPDPLHILHNPSGPVTALTVIKSQDGTDEQLVSGSENGVITIWDMKVNILI